MTHATTLRVLGTTRLRISHRTRYRFATPLETCRLRAYLEPLDTLSQRLIHHQLEILPSADARWQSHDDHGNLRTSASLSSGVSEVEVLAISTVEVDRRPCPAVVLDADWKAVAETSQERRFLKYLMPSIGISAGPTVSSYARVSFPVGATLGQGLRSLLSRVRRELADGGLEAPGSSRSVPRDPDDSEALTCFVIACLRSLGLPTRFMQGYRLDGPPGAAKQHGWAAVWTGDRWLDVDPTLGRLGRVGHVLVAQGRDASDVAPLRAQTRGGGRCWRETEIQIRQPALDSLRLPAA